MKEIQEFKNISLDKINISAINEDIIDESDVDDIVADIKAKGLSRPIVVSLEDDKYSLILGNRRFMAAKKVNSASIFCAVINGKAGRPEVAAIALCYTSLEDMLNNEDRILAINYLIENFNGDLNKISSITNLSTEEIKAYLNFNEGLEKIKGILNSTKTKNFEKRLTSLTPEELDILVKLLGKLN
jgi:ParB/RepB/Spo0J family partition protein